MEKCMCDLRTRLVGDGCRVCNPTLALECADETIEELRAVNAELLEALEAIRNLDTGYVPGCECELCVAIDAAIARARG